MLGPPKRRLLDQPIRVSLDDLVPPDNFYRHLDATLDLSFVRTWVQDLYAVGGRPSIDPVVFFKLQLILFFEGLRSERKLMVTVQLHLAHRWYLGYRLDEPLPDHSSLTRIRERQSSATCGHTGQGRYSMTGAPAAAHRRIRPATLPDGYLVKELPRAARGINEA